MDVSIVKPHITAVSDFASSLGMYSSIGKAPGSTQETVTLDSGAEALILRGVPVFRSGTFRDSMGDENTWSDLHIQEIVNHFEVLSSSGTFDRVPLRCDHFSLFSGGLSNVVGYHENLRAEKRISPVDNAEYTYLVADLVVLREDAKQNIQSGLWSKRSAEIGVYRTNSGEEFWPTLVGTAMVDVPAVEGLSFSKETDRSHRTLVLEDSMSNSTTGTGGQGTDPAPQTPAATFRVGGAETSDFAAVQAHIDAQEAELENLRKYQMDTVTAERENFVNSLADEGKILATQKEMFSKLALGMSADDFSEFKASYDGAGPQSLLGNYASGQHSAPGAGPQAQPDDTDTDEVDAAQVRMHSAIGTPSADLAKFECFKSIQSRHPEATVDAVIAGTYK